MDPAVEELLAVQAGVLSRRQLLALGLADHDIARMLRRRIWATVHEGVYVNHTGELTWLQRAWAAVLFSWPAALSHGSALRASDGPGAKQSDAPTLHVMVERNRRLVAPPGVRVHRRHGFAAHVQWNLGPPRVRYEQAALDVAATAASEFEAVAALAKVVSSRRTTAARVLLAATERQRLPRRDWICDVLRDISEGTCSVLEHGYLNRVERPHGLPRARRQSAGVGRVGRIYRDAAYTEQVLVELDGRLFHDSTGARDRDFDRDLVALVGGKVTARLSWGQVIDRPCWTAGQIGSLLADRGWTGQPVPCGPGCALRG